MSARIGRHGLAWITAALLVGAAACSVDTDRRELYGPITPTDVGGQLPGPYSPPVNGAQGAANNDVCIGFGGIDVAGAGATGGQQAGSNATMSAAERARLLDRVCNAVFTGAPGTGGQSGVGEASSALVRRGNPLGIQGNAATYEAGGPATSGLGALGGGAQVGPDNTAAAGPIDDFLSGVGDGAQCFPAVSVASDGQIAAILDAVNQLEIHDNALALPRVVDPLSRSYARLMIMSHTLALREGDARFAAMAVVPQPSSTSQALARDLGTTPAWMSSVQGAAFDAEYLDRQVMAHLTALQLLDALLPQAEREAMRALVDASRLVTTEHLAYACDLRAGGAGE